jgi:hypothetical protein
MTKRKRTKLLIPPMKYMEDIMKGIKRKPKDPLAALKRHYPVPWRVVRAYPGMVTDRFSWMSDWTVCDRNDNFVVLCRSLALARAIARMGSAT